MEDLVVLVDDSYEYSILSGIQGNDDSNSREIFVDYDFDNSDGYSTAVFRLPISLSEAIININNGKFNKLSNYRHKNGRKLSDYAYIDRSETIKEYSSFSDNYFPLYSLEDYYEYYMDILMQYYCLSDIRFNGETGMFSHVKAYLNGSL